MSKARHEDATDARRALDAIVSNIHILKTRIEAVQCMAIDARLDLMDGDTTQDPTRTARALQPIADELNLLIDDVAAMLDAIRRASPKASGSSRLQ